MKADKQALWWLISVLMLASALYALIAFKPNFNFNLYDTILGIFAGLFTYCFGRFLQARKNKQLVNIQVCAAYVIRCCTNLISPIALRHNISNAIADIRGIFISSVIISPPAEEILFRFVIIVVLFSSSLPGILVSIAVWAAIHLIYEIMSGTPFKYYRTSLGFADSLASGMILSAIYVFSGFNLYAPLIAHALHNFLIWISIAYPEKGVLTLRLKEKTRSVLLSFSYKSLNIYSYIKYLRIKLSGFETSCLKRLYQWRACCSSLAAQKAFHKFPQPSPIIIVKPENKRHMFSGFTYMVDTLYPPVQVEFQRNSPMYSQQGCNTWWNLRFHLYRRIKDSPCMSSISLHDYISLIFLLLLMPSAFALQQSITQEALI